MAKIVNKDLVDRYVQLEEALYTRRGEIKEQPFAFDRRAIHKHNEELLEHFKTIPLSAIEMQIENQKGRLWAWLSVGFISLEEHNLMIKAVYLAAKKRVWLSMTREQQNGTEK
ncbi:hypothetical protein [Vibrio mediterranei]|uniref:hypothetical protein n=1 Tax=Vibrio mediterranei TaxID=689 RepID=UPI0040681D41